MKNVIEILNNYYKPVENAKRSRSFFFSLTDYVKHIKTTPELEKIIQRITKDKKELLKKRKELLRISIIKSLKNIQKNSRNSLLK